MKWAVLINNGFRHEYAFEVEAKTAAEARNIAKTVRPGDWRMEDFKVRRLK